MNSFYSNLILFIGTQVHNPEISESNIWHSSTKKKELNQLNFEIIKLAKMSYFIFACKFYSGFVRLQLIIREGYT